MWLSRSLLVGLALLGTLLVMFLAGLQAGLLVLLGLGFGLVLQGFRFGFTTGWRQLILQRNPGGVYGQMLLMSLAVVLSVPLTLAHPGEIVGAIAPISWSLILGAFVFGLMMQLADGCGSGTLYKAGAASSLSWVVLPSFIVGSTVGASHQPAWLALGGPLDGLSTTGDPLVIDLGQALGAPSAILLSLAGCGLVTYFAWQRARSRPQQMSDCEGCPPSLKPWLVGGLLLAILYLVHLVVAGQPWGIVYGLGLWGAKIGAGLGLDWSGDAFWGQAPHAQRLLDPVLWDITTLTNFGLLYGSMMAARWAGPPKTSAADQALRPIHWLIGLMAGLVMGYTSRLAFGCNIGGFLGGVASASLHGWVWFAMAFLGSLIGVRIRLKVKMP